MVACRHQASPPTVVRTTDAAGAPPVISSVSPQPLLIQSGAINALIIRGSGFVPDSNTVSIGSLSFAAIRAEQGGTVITIRVPDRMPSGGEAPPMLWVDGEYPLIVRNTRGQSRPHAVAVRGQP